MNPRKAKAELQKKIVELNEVYTLGLSAKELSQTAYFKKLKELYEKEIESFYIIKKLTPYVETIQDHHRTTSKGNRIISGKDYFAGLVATEIAIQQKEAFLQMIQNDIEEGEIAGKDLADYKRKLGK
jgi:hypothetical protein